jgi:hypothetical protein
MPIVHTNLVSFSSHSFSSARIARHERVVEASGTLVDTVNPLHLLPQSLFRISLAERIDFIPSVINTAASEFLQSCCRTLGPRSPHQPPPSRFFPSYSSPIVTFHLAMPPKLAKTSSTYSPTWPSRFSFPPFPPLDTRDQTPISSQRMTPLDRAAMRLDFVQAAIKHAGFRSWIEYVLTVSNPDLNNVRAKQSVGNLVMRSREVQEEGEAGGKGEKKTVRNLFTLLDNLERGDKTHREAMEEALVRGGMRVYEKEIKDAATCEE